MASRGCAALLVMAALAAPPASARGTPPGATDVAPVPWRSVLEALGTPLRYTRISSVFSLRRWHPILRRRRPHLGVDFAAPPGTPVRAVATGRITRATRHGPLGRFVRIAHAEDVESLYAHLGRIAGPMRPGRLVRRGDVIGWVGASGRATGPHLHFAVSRNGWYFDPLDVGAPPIPSAAELRAARAATPVTARRSVRPPTGGAGRVPVRTTVVQAAEPAPAGPMACGRWSFVPLAPSDPLTP